MPVQQTYTPNSILGPLARTVVTVGKQVLRVKGAGVPLPWWVKWTVAPFSVSTSWPLVVTVPADYISYTYGGEILHRAQEQFLTSTNPTIVRIREAMQQTQRVAPEYAALAFDFGQDELLEALGRYLQDSAEQSADGQIVVQVPQMWFVDP